MPDVRDYIIKDGQFIGEFEKLYQNCEEPWNQVDGELFRTDKSAILNLITKYNCRNVIEIGCGLGSFTQRIFDLGIDVTGIDVSPTAIKKAKEKHPGINFLVGDILDFFLYERINPDCIVMAEVTWYVLDKLDIFMDYLKRGKERKLLIHTLTTYPPGVQKYGIEKFTCLDEILKYFNLDYEEFGSMTYKENSSTRTYFAAFV